MVRTPAAATARHSAESCAAVSAAQRPSLRSAPAIVMRSSSGTGPVPAAPRIPRRRNASRICGGAAAKGAGAASARCFDCLGAGRPSRL